MYLSFVTGNISNLKLPCALAALEQAGLKANSEEGEVVSTIAIAVSFDIFRYRPRADGHPVRPDGQQTPKLHASADVPWP